MIEFEVYYSALVGYLQNLRLEVAYAIGVMSPQISHTWTLKASDTSNNLSFRNALAP